MAVMGDSDRGLALNTFVRECFVIAGNRADLDVVDMRAALDATDDWIDTNQGSFNSALPLPARTTLTLKQKTFLFTYVALRRAQII